MSSCLCRVFGDSQGPTTAMRVKLEETPLDAEVSRLVETAAVDLDEVARVVGASYGCAAEALRRRGRKRYEARDVAIYLACRVSRLTNAEIGARLGGIKAAAISHACRRVAAAMEADAGLAQRVRDVEAHLRPKITD